MYDGVPSGAVPLDRAAVTTDQVGQIVLQFDDDAQGDPQLTHRYLWGPAVDQILADEAVTSLAAPGEILWPLPDHLGTARDLAQRDPSTGETTIANHRTYDSYGDLLTETNPALDHLFAFTGRALDESTSLQNNLNRWYDAQTGRWVSQDPIGFRGGDTSLYRYVANAPAAYTDPSGLSIAPLGIQMRFWEKWHLLMGDFATREEAQSAGEDYLGRYGYKGWGVWVEPRRVKGKTRWETLIFKPKPKGEREWIVFSLNMQMSALASPISLGGGGGVAGKVWESVRRLFCRGGSKAAAPAASGATAIGQSVIPQAEAAAVRLAWQNAPAEGQYAVGVIRPATGEIHVGISEFGHPGLLRQVGISDTSGWLGFIFNSAGEAGGYSALNIPVTGGHQMPAAVFERVMAALRAPGFVP